MSEWITHRLPTEGDADVDGDVVVPRKSDATPDDDCNNWQNYGWVTLGQRWWPGNSSSRKAAAEQEAAVAAANPDPTPDPAAEPSPAVAGVPSDEELWEVQLEACKQTRPDVPWFQWGDVYHGPSTLAAHRALYDYGYRRCLEEAKATWELNNGPASDLTLLQKANAELASDLTALQEENAQLKSEAERLKDETHGLGRGLNNAAKDLEYYKRHLNGAYCRIKELERELERRGGEPEPAPEPAVRKVVDFHVVERRQNEVSTTYALCDDGSLWYIHAFPDSEWISLPAIPQTPIQ